MKKNKILLSCLLVSSLIFISASRPMYSVYAGLDPITTSDASEIQNTSLTTEAEEAIDNAVIIINSQNNNGNQNVTSLNVTSDKKVLRKGQYFNIGICFKEKANSNTATLTFTYDSSTFEYRGFSPAEGVTSLAETNEDGVAAVTIMISDYETTEYGNAVFSVKEEAELKRERKTIDINVAYVIGEENGGKTIAYSDDTSPFYTDGGLIGDTNEDGFITLIDISNYVDMFGYDVAALKWIEAYQYFDLNDDGTIDVQDIVTVSKVL